MEYRTPYPPASSTATNGVSRPPPPPPPQPPQPPQPMQFVWVASNNNSRSMQNARQIAGTSRLPAQPAPAQPRVLQSSVQPHRETRQRPRPRARLIGRDEELTLLKICTSNVDVYDLPTGGRGFWELVTNLFKTSCNLQSYSPQTSKRRVENLVKEYTLRTVDPIYPDYALDEAIDRWIFSLDQLRAQAKEMRQPRKDRALPSIETQRHRDDPAQHEAPKRRRIDSDVQVKEEATTPSPPQSIPLPAHRPPGSSFASERQERERLLKSIGTFLQDMRRSHTVPDSRLTVIERRLDHMEERLDKKDEQVREMRAMLTSYKAHVDELEQTLREAGASQLLGRQSTG